jgi:hypothetical protein
MAKASQNLKRGKPKRGRFSIIWPWFQRVPVNCL